MDTKIKKYHVNRLMKSDAIGIQILQRPELREQHPNAERHATGQDLDGDIRGAEKDGPALALMTFLAGNLETNMRELPRASASEEQLGKICMICQVLKTRRMLPAGAFEACQEFQHIASSCSLQVGLDAVAKCLHCHLRVAAKPRRGLCRHQVDELTGNTKSLSHKLRRLI